jgi:dihydropteroate synthase
MHQDFMKAIQIPRIMGIINLTEDSFSDGGYYLSERSALAHAEN